MTTITERLASDMTRAMKSREKERLEAIRYLRSVLQREEKNSKNFTDNEAITLLTQEAKKRREAAELYRSNDREDAAEKELFELKIILEYLPQQLTDDEVREIIAEVVAKTGASSKADIGKVMGPLMGQIRGKFDGARAKELAAEALP